MLLRGTAGILRLRMSIVADEVALVAGGSARRRLPQLLVLPAQGDYVDSLDLIRQIPFPIGRTEQDREAGRGEWGHCTSLGSIKIRGAKVAGIDARTSKRRPRTPVRLSDGGRFRRLTPRILMLPFLIRASETRRGLPPVADLLPCIFTRIGRYPDQAQAARTCIYGHLEERNAPRLSTSSLRRRLRLTLDDRVRPPHHPADNPVVSVQRA